MLAAKSIATNICRKSPILLPERRGDRFSHLCFRGSSVMRFTAHQVGSPRRRDVCISTRAYFGADIDGPIPRLLTPERQSSFVGRRVELIIRSTGLCPTSRGEIG